ncbi:unnamed protein product [Ixodes persulcatus]
MMVVRDKLKEKKRRYMLSTYLYMLIFMEILPYDYFRRIELQHTRNVVLRCLDASRRFLVFTWPYLIANLTSRVESLTNTQAVFSRILRASARSVRQMTWMEVTSRIEASRKLKKLTLTTISGVLPTTFKSTHQLRSSGGSEGRLRGKLPKDGGVRHQAETTSPR